MYPELAGVGAAFRDNRAGFKPDQFGSACAKAAIAPESQFARIAVKIAIAALHRMDGERISNTPCPASEAGDIERPRKNAADLFTILNQRKVNAQVLGVAAKVGEALVLKILYGHVR